MESKEYSEELDVQKYWIVLRRRWLPALAVFGAVVSLAFVYAMFQKPVYQAESKILIRSNRTSTLTGLGDEALGQLEALTMEDSPLDTQAEILRSTPILQETIAALGLKNDEGEPLTPSTFLAGLTVQGVTGTDVLEVSYKSDDPELAASIVNKLVDAYLRNNVQSNRAVAASAREFVEQQLPKTETAVRDADSALRQFREQNELISLNEEATEAVRIIAGLDGQIADLQAQLADTAARSQGLQSRLGLSSEQAVAVAALSQAPGVQEVLVQLQQAQSELAVQQTRYRPGYPVIANLERRIAALNSLLQERVGQVAGANAAVDLGSLQVGELQRDLFSDLVRTETARIGLVQRVSKLSETRATYRQRASALPRLQQIERELERKVQAAQGTYETLLTRLQQIQLIENQNIGNVSVISPALEPEDPVGLSRSAILLGSGAAGVLLAIAVAFAIDLTDRSIKTVKEARELFGYTLLGVIPSTGRGGRSNTYAGGLDQPVPRVIVRDSPSSPMGDSYHMLQANLKFISSDKELKTIVVTSSVGKEGRSEVAANLGAAMAQIGRRVLLVDADMRRPAQHHIWDLMNVAGLSNVIVDQVTFDAAVQRAMPSLYVLTAGVMPPNPIALLDSKRMASLVAAFARDYDYVIFDAPPLSGTADAAVLSRMADGIILVVRPGVADVPSGKAAKDFLAQSGQTVLGMVINGVDMKSEPDSYFYYSGDHSEASSSSSHAGPMRVPFRIMDRSNRL
jgi:capsular exopolysaccharide synthesis family protein